MKKLKILVISDFIFEDEKGGSGRVITELSKNFAYRGHYVVNLTFSKLNKVLVEKVSDNRVIYRCNFTDNIYKLYKNFLKTSFLVLKETKFDIINYHHPLSGFLFNTINFNNNIKKIPKVYFFHSPWSKEYEIRAKEKKIPKLLSKINSFLRKKVESLVISKSDRIIVLSDYMKKYLKKYHNVEEEKIYKIFGAVDIEKFSPAKDKVKLREELNLPIDKTIILTVRNLEPRMGLDNLLIAMKYAIQEKNNLFLVIVGKGSLENKLKILTKKLEIAEFVKFTGSVDDKLLPKYYQSADLFILPTKDLEGFGLVTVESLACGTPVLGTPVGGTIEILSPLGLLLEDTTSQGIKNGIIKFCNLSVEEKTELSKKCRELVEKKYSWEKLVEKIENLFFKII